MNDYGRTLGARLRAIRQQQGLSLHGVEQRSGGVWKAVVVGSYERGDRAISVHRLAELAAFYGVPVSELLPARGAPAPTPAVPRIVIDLHRLAELHRGGQAEAAPLARYAAAIQAQRGDYNGRVITLRAEDLRSLAVLYDTTPEALTSRLLDWGVLSPAPSPTG